VTARAHIVLLLCLATASALARAGEAPAADPRPEFPAELTGRVTPEQARPLTPAATPELAQALKPYEVAPAAYDWKMKLHVRGHAGGIYDVTFPSPRVTKDECNNTVHGEYFVSERPGRRPTVIVLHILAGDYTAERVTCGALASEGIHAMLIMMPYYGPRRPPGFKLRATDDPQLLVAALQQAVTDVRRAAEWLGTRPEVDPDAIGLLGISLGGFVAATTAGVDGHFPRVVIVLAGGDLVKVLDNRSRETRQMRETAARKGFDTDRLRELLQPIEPLTFASRLKGSQVLMLNGRQDEVVPPICSKELAQAGGTRILWYEATHYSMAWFIPDLLVKSAEFLGQK
jgi:dienelactone hydrolase